MALGSRQVRRPPFRVPRVAARRSPHRRRLPARSSPSSDQVLCLRVWYSERIPLERSEEGRSKGHRKGVPRWPSAVQ